MRLALLCVFSFSITLLSSQSRFERASAHLIIYNFDSTFLELKAMDNAKEARLLSAVLFNFAGYADYLEFIEKSNFIGRIAYQNLIYFLDARVKTPSSREFVNLDYVKLKSRIISHLANDVELQDAVEEQEKLQSYLNSIENKNEDFELASLYLNVFDVLLALIERDVEKLELGAKNADRALSFGDTTLYLILASTASHGYVYKRELMAYNQFLANIYEVAKHVEVKSVIYYQVVDYMLDGLIYAKHEDRDFIEQKLMELNNSKSYKRKFYHLFLKYLYFHPYPADEDNLALIKKFGHEDLEAMIEFCRTDILHLLQNNDLIELLIQASRVLFVNDNCSLAMELMLDAINSARAIFSQDLAETLSDYKVRSIKREKELVLQQEKEKNDIYLKLGILVFVFFLMTGVLAIALAQRKNKLKAKNEENEALLKEKDLLMKEIHHRVKNNFELVSALLELQSTEIENEAAKKKLYEGQARIQSLSLLHNKLYQTDETTSINMQQYISELSSLMLKSADLTEKVSVTVQADDIHLDIDTVTPLGLIINELITNSFKYGFKGSGPWGLRISLEKSKNSYLLTYIETGVENYWDFQSSSNKGLGMMLIKNLIRQLQGSLDFEFNQGAQFKILFKDKLKRKNTD